MAGFSTALKKLLQFHRTTERRRRRQARPLCDSVESLESRVLLSCITASTDTQPAEVDTCSEVVEVDEFGNEIVTTPGVQETVGATGDYDGTGTVTDLSQTFYLHSNPGASYTIYLDFDGHVTSGTHWNTAYNGGEDIVTPAYSFEGDSSFSDNELARIQRIWQRVAEDFLPFDVDVTTEDPGVAALSNSGGGDNAWGIRVVIGGDASWRTSQNAGGTAMVGSFDASSDTPAFIFEDNLGNGNEKYTAEAITHEVGHTLGLSHDGASGTSYYTGHGSGETGWAPIMGVGYYKELTQWSNGDYAGATNTQDDLQIITTQNGFGYRVDDHGNTAGTATSFVVVSNTVNETGIIERNTDYDMFSFTTGAGTVDITASPSARGANLDILLELYDADGNLVATANPSEQLGATLSLSLAAGTYYLRVSGTGKGDPLNGGYSDYGSLGFYSLTGTIVDPNGTDTTGPRVIGSSSSGATAGTLDTFTLTFSEAIADGTFTTADVNLYGPSGAITPTAVNKLSSTQYEVTFAPQTALGNYTLVVGPQISDAAGNLMDQDQDGNTGEATDDQFSTTATIADTTGPRVIGSSSSGATASTLDTFTVTFSEAIADGTFTTADVVLSGPGGAITPTAVNKISSTQYEVTFAPQSADGTYTLTIGPQIADLAGNAMDQDQDGTLGEATDDQFTTTAVLPEHVGPRVIGATASGDATDTLNTFTVTFSEPIADGTFTLADVTLTGPNGGITPTAVNKLSSTQYEVTFATQTALGTYTLTVGPNISDLMGNLMDQDQDGTTGEASDDQFSTTAAISDTNGPRIVSSSSSGSSAGTLDTFTVTFSEPIADGTFTTADVTLTGPNGGITPAAVNKLSSTQYEVTFAPQTAVGSYTLTVSPQITDLAGNVMDQDQDGVAGEATDDRFTTTASIADTTGPRVVSASSSGATTGSLDTFTLTFSEAIADGTFTAADVTLTGPNGAITAMSVTKLSSTQYAVTFVPQTATGTYTLSVGPNITDLAGNAMDQDQDGFTGETTDDRFTTSATLVDTTGPRVINSVFSGASAGTVDKVTLTFSEAIADGTFTVADVSLTGPLGAITPAAVNKLSSTQYEVTFTPQTTEGVYTLTLSPQISDAAGNLMDQDQDGTGGEATQDQYSASTVLESVPLEWDFDFGSSSSAVEPGYQQVTESTSYSNSLGYGWTDGKVRSKARSGDALIEDFNWSDDATFAVDVPNGTYDVTITLGDTRSDLNNVAVFLEGQQVDTVSTNSGQVVTLTYQVDVSDGQLTLRLQSLDGKRGSFALSSLSIVSSSTAQAAQIEGYSSNESILGSFWDNRRGRR